MIGMDSRQAATNLTMKGALMANPHNQTVFKIILDNFRLLVDEVETETEIAPHLAG